MNEEIIKDCEILNNELKDILFELDFFVYPGSMDKSSYTAFIKDKRISVYASSIKEFANKIHGLKGLISFVVLPAKDYLHTSEEIIKALSSFDLILTDTIFSYLRSVITTVDKILEDVTVEFQVPVDYSNITKELISKQGDVTLFKKLLEERNTDKGQIRKREIKTITVKKEEYHLLFKKINDMFEFVMTNDKNVSFLNKFIEHYNHIIKYYNDIKKISLDYSRYSQMVIDLAKEYGVKCELKFINNNDVQCEAEFWSLIHEISNHVIKNAVIHGIENPVDRSMNGKHTTGNITVVLDADETSIYFQITDDGRGIDIEKISAILKEKGMATQEEIDRMSKQDLIKSIFLQGVSTKSKSLDNNAGRGVGASAILESTLQFGGKLDIDSEVGKGTIWNFKFPKTDIFLECIVFRIGEHYIGVPLKSIDFFKQDNEIDKTKILTEKVVRVVKNNEDLFYKYIDLMEFLKLNIEKKNEVSFCFLEKSFCFSFDEAHDTQMFNLVNDFSFMDMVNSDIVLGMSLFNNKPLIILDIEMLKNGTKKI